MVSPVFFKNNMYLKKIPTAYAFWGRKPFFLCFRSMKCHSLKQNSRLTFTSHFLIASTPPTYQRASRSLFSTPCLSWIMKLERGPSTALKLPAQQWSSLMRNVWRKVSLRWATLQEALLKPTLSTCSLDVAIFLSCGARAPTCKWNRFHSMGRKRMAWLVCTQYWHKVVPTYGWRYIKPNFSLLQHKNSQKHSQRN